MQYLVLIQTQIGWVEVSTEDGVGGFLWYLKAEGETRLDLKII